MNEAPYAPNPPEPTGWRLLSHEDEKLTYINRTGDRKVTFTRDGYVAVNPQKNDRVVVQKDSTRPNIKRILMQLNEESQ